MAQTGEVRSGGNDRSLLVLFRAIAADNRHDVSRRLESSPDLAVRPIQIGATRADPDEYFLAAIRRHTYRGDTALHIAAAAHQLDLVELLVAHSAAVRARNRRGAEPLHYAADGRRDPDAQRAIIGFLVEHGADPNAPDNSGVAPIHRAVRTRSSGAVKALIQQGADALLRNKSGSTPLHLAVQTTGASHSGSDAAKDEQARIIALLLEHGASPSDRDANGKTVATSATGQWLRDLLGTD